MDVLIPILTGVISGAFAAGGAYAAVSVKLAWLRADVNTHGERITALERSADPGAAFRLAAIRRGGGA